jgi:hypothetical protein
VTGGSSKDYTVTQRGSNSLIVADLSEVDGRLRRSIDFRATRAKVSQNAPGGYTQERKEAKLRFPKVLANGNRTENSISINMSSDPEATAAEKLEMQLIAAQILSQAAFQDYLQAGAVDG